MKYLTLPVLLAFALLLAVFHLQMATPLELAAQWRAIGSDDLGMDSIVFKYAHLPRTVLAIFLGVAMALSGSLLQQLTQNPLASPMTLGASAGAWCAIVLGGLLLPATWHLPIEWLAMGGSLFALLLVVSLAGWRQLHGLGALLAGTAVNLLLGSVAGIAVMMNDQYSRSLLVWGAGDMAQNDWYWVGWVLPRLLPALLVLPMLCRPLQLIQLGSDAATAAGLNVARFAILTSLLALWLNGLAISAVGMIGFISLLAPALARLLGAAKPAQCLMYSAVLGVITLLAADTLAMYVSSLLPELLPSSAAAGLLGAPVLVWLCLRQKMPDRVGGALAAMKVRRRVPLPVYLFLGLALMVLCAVLGRDVQGAWTLEWPDAGLWALRWPRLLAASAAGVGLAMAGLVLQRLLNNPLASPDLLGISSGASLGMLLGMALGVSQPWLMTSAGAALVLMVLCWLAPRQSPARLVLLGVGLSSLLEAVLQFVLAQGSNDSFKLLNWLAGSTYHTNAGDALALAAWVALLGLLILPASRVLALLGLGESHARATGLNVRRARALLFLLAGLLSLAISSQFGPLAFIGLVLPQLAIQLGARKVSTQLLLASLLGATLLALADFASRTLFFPMQLPVGALGSLSCGMLLVLALLTTRRGAP
ncbi:Fe(3+)-hydroxamate ABC transporter permease FhuB [Chitinibacter bivalviorum]|uniref:Fe(3+)-hydroxamate ABC transporter permease FhuB n=1 Tax=Chitinibacter bivalviorum TaxID=2739434 RepID=A0A7H9BGP0_9NEIS|nr:Fe(3+)-hydroxamate ABC transporter permease FhuB [Chitinibacter bivalviorum]QLG87582.1 Fe(3+)-hydroxamate ABC transporter permease FhuB [Chitinibacter bivalviorum]